MAKFLGKTPPPLQDKVLGENGLFSDSWRQYISRFPDTFDAIPSRLNAVSLVTQGASIGATDFAGGTLGTGVYRASYYARITRAGTVSSSLTVTIGWTDGGVACSLAGAAMVGNTTATVQSGGMLIRVDAGTAVTYTTTYASAGATTMEYALDVSIEKVKA